MSSTAEQIKQRLGIAEVIGGYIKVDKAGSNYKARCPFHNEKTPSFFISPARNSYYCFGCAAKGDIFTFVQEFEKVDFLGALKILAEKAGVELTQYKSEDKGELNRLRNILEQSTIFYQSKLIGAPKQYLLDRGLTEKTISEWRIGYAANEWRLLSDELRRKNISIADMEKVGLVKKSDKEGAPTDSYYDRFRARVMFPLIDPSDRIVGYSGRLFGVPDTDGAKYLNSPETELFHKSEFLYGYNKAKSGIREWGYAVLVEGQMDLLMCHQAGFTNAVATSGTSLTSAHLEKLKRISDNLMIVYDADRAGLKATLRAWTAALSLGMDIKIAGLPEGEDPASLILQGKEKFKDALKNSKHIIEYYLDILLREYHETEKTSGKQQGKEGERKLWKTVATELAPFVAAVPSAVDSAHFISRINMQTGIPEEELRSEFAAYKKRQEAEAAGEKPAQNNQTARPAVVTPRAIGQLESNSPKENVLDRLVGIVLMLRSKKTVDIKEPKDPKDVSPEVDPDAVTARVNQILEAGDASLKGQFSDRLDKAPPDLVFEAEVMHEGSENLGRDVDGLYIELEERILKEQFTGVMNELQRAEKSGDKEKAAALLTKCQEISLALSSLRHKKTENQLS